ncbi:MAG: LysE family translocator [Cellvibrionaceae bacterium]
MTLTSMLALFGAMLVLALIPGPGVFTVMAASLSSGLRQGVATVIGIVCADFVFIILSVMGLTALAQSMGGFFVIVKYLGALYLMWLAVSLWRSSNLAVDIEDLKSTDSRVSVKSSYLTGFLTTLGNPKAIFFYVGFFPAFLDLATVGYVDIAIILAITVVSVGGVMFGYAYTASKTRDLLSTPKARKHLNRSASGVMACSSVLLASKA